MGLKRLDKLIALNCNVSRKDARKLIKDAAVSVNSRVVLRAEELVDADVDDISVKGYNFTAKEHVYIMLNKPKGVISATTDPAKKTVIDIIPDELRRKKAVILNMENVDKALPRRVVDFLSGSVYALDGRVKKIAQSTYLFCPHNMDVVGDLETVQEAASYI